MSRRMSPERHTVYVQRRAAGKDHTLYIKAARARKNELRARFGGV